MPRRALLLIPVLLAALAGCRNPPSPKVENKTYTVRGEVVRLDPATHSAVLKHEKIEGWMEAMTMEFVVKDPAEFARLAVGDQIRATLYVNDLEIYLSGIQMVAKAPAK